jgi:hypothetical protein
MITKRCCFERIGRCGILSEYHCDGCKFKKNFKEFVAANSAAEKSLRERGLKAAKVETENGAIITTIPLERGE